MAVLITDVRKGTGRLKYINAHILTLLIYKYAHANTYTVDMNAYIVSCYSNVYLHS